MKKTKKKQKKNRNQTTLQYQANGKIQNQKESPIPQLHKPNSQKKV